MNKYNTRATIEDTNFFDTFITTTKMAKKVRIRFYRWFVVIFCAFVIYSFILHWFTDFRG